ncbi:MAG: nuclear transport factor 2 family protein [Phycisphaeraceae bacterium]|nr:MAG: nuclear transport factor 2 family protein [Phycisphaeraceae bacterium]
MTPECAVEIVRRFAIALDREDYKAAAGLLDGSCVYSIRGQTHRGPDEIIASYKGNGDAAAVTFDEIRYESRVRDAGGGSIVVEFADHIRHGERRLDHSCEQRMRVEAGRIVRIDHCDLPGQRESLEQFRRECGLG